MVRNDFLSVLKAFTEDAVKDLILPQRVQKSTDTPTYVPASVYLMRLPDAEVYKDKVPYIIHQVVESTDEQSSGGITQSYVTVRSIFCVFNNDGQVGALQLNELVDRFRLAILSTRIIGNRYTLDLTKGDVLFRFYTEDIAPYYAGELESVWRGTSVEHDVSEMLLGGGLP